MRQLDQRDHTPQCYLHRAGELFLTADLCPLQISLVTHRIWAERFLLVVWIQLGTRLQYLL